MVESEKGDGAMMMSGAMRKGKREEEGLATLGEGEAI
jgi:hypothetical protein